MLPPDEVAIETPEQIDLMLEPAGLGARFVAWVVDGLWKLFALFLLFVVGLIFFGLVNARLSDWFKGYYFAALLLIVGALLMAYDVYFEVRHNGQTPGKRHQGLRVLRESGGPVDFRCACIRSLLAVADLLPAFYLLGATLILLTRRHQRLGDLAAGTMVIRERAPALLEHDDLVEELASDQYVFTPEQLSTCTPADRQVLRAFFQRYDELKADARFNVAERLAKLFLGKTGFQVSAEFDDECFLASLQRDLESWLRQGR
jgi:uncharacterized RDD family membrane protein YckC